MNVFKKSWKYFVKSFSGEIAKKHAMTRVVAKAFFKSKCVIFFFASDAIDILCLVYSNFYKKLFSQ